MGTPAAAVPSLRRLVDDGHEIAGVYTQPDRPSGRGNKITFSAVKQFALDHAFPVFQPVKVKTPDALEQFRSLAADVAVVVAYGRILPETFLNAFPLGAINVHFSLLPKYRGAAPVNWAIVTGERTTGVTTMKMDAGLDTGDILLQRETEIGSDETAIELMERLSIIGAELLGETLERVGDIEPTAQEEALATLAPIMKKEVGRIAWSRPAEEIARRIRGFQPFPTAYSFLDGKRVTFWRSAVAGSAGPGSAPGTVLSAKGNAIEIGCGDGSVLVVSEIQLEGKKRMKAADVINGGLIRAGDRFD